MTVSASLQEPDAVLRDWTIAERLDEIERVLKFDPDVPYRRSLIREYLALTTDPNEARNGNR